MFAASASPSHLPTKVRPGSARSRPKRWPPAALPPTRMPRSEEHTSELQSRLHLVCRLLLEKKKKHKEINIGRPVDIANRLSVIPAVTVQRGVTTSVLSTTWVKPHQLLIAVCLCSSSASRL